MVNERLDDLLNRLERQRGRGRVVIWAFSVLAGLLFVLAVAGLSVGVVALSASESTRDSTAQTQCIAKGLSLFAQGTSQALALPIGADRANALGMVAASSEALKACG